MYNTLLFTRAIMLCLTSLGLTYLKTKSLQLLTTFTHFAYPAHSLPLVTTNLFSVSMGFFLYLFSFVCLFKILRIHDIIVFVFLCLISLSIMPSRSTHIVSTGRFPSFLCCWIIFHYIYIYIYTTHLLYSFIYWWTCRLFPCRDYYE